MTLDLSWITPRVSTGGALTSPDDVAALVVAGCTHVIDCRDDFDDHQLLAVDPHLQVLWNGTPDDGQPKPDSWFGASFGFGLAALSLFGTRVHCHCAAGVNRGPSTAYLLLRALGAPADETAALVRAGRPQAGIAYAEQADSFLGRVVFGTHS